MLGDDEIINTETLTSVLTYCDVADSNNCKAILMNYKQSDKEGVVIN